MALFAHTDVVSMAVPHSSRSMHSDSIEKPDFFSHSGGGGGGVYNNFKTTEISECTVEVYRLSRLYTFKNKVNFLTKNSFKMTYPSRQE